MKTRAEEERKERKNKLTQAKDDFKKMMEDAKLNIRSVDGPAIKCLKVFRQINILPYYFDGLERICSLQLVGPHSASLRQNT